jgi:hypothetical protein
VKRGTLTNGNRRSLQYATPDFLLSLVALASFMRLSLTKAAYADMSSAAWQEIRVRSGRDDNTVARKLTDFPVNTRREINSGKNEINAQSRN